MRLKRVSFKVAKAIKEAGYPQGDIKITKVGWYNRAGIYTRDLPFLWKGDDMFVAIAPTYLEVWLWLWREKGIQIVAEPRQKVFVYIKADFYGLPKELASSFEDPEEAFIAAIEYLVDNNLIK